MDLARAKIETTSPGVVQVPVPVLAPVEGQLSSQAPGRKAAEDERLLGNSNRQGNIKAASKVQSGTGEGKEEEKKE